MKELSISEAGRLVACSECGCQQELKRPTYAASVFRACPYCGRWAEHIVQRTLKTGSKQKGGADSDADA